MPKVNDYVSSNKEVFSCIKTICGDYNGRAFKWIWKIPTPALLVTVKDSFLIDLYSIK